MKGYILQSMHEQDRQLHVSGLGKLLPSMQLVEAVYPLYEKIPFLHKMIEISKKRTGVALRPAEIGCLMSHRRIWSQIVQKTGDEKEHYLVLESDSMLIDDTILQQQFERMAAAYDIFFWGAWDGHMQLLHSTRQILETGYVYGVPFIRSVYCTYGYSLNKKAARYLLQQTKKIHYPVDQFKHYIEKDVLLMGGVMPELISTTGMKSYIRTNTGRSWYIRLFIILLDLKNKLVCSLK